MPRARDPNRDKAFEIWKEKKGDITNRALAELLNVPEKTISAWKSRDKWNAVLQKNECSTAKRSNNSRGAPKGNKYAVGNKGNKNPKPKFAERNTEALKHGLFSRYMPKETLEIMGMIAGSDPADLIWMQIEIQFAAIIRAQEIMFVKSKGEMIKELKKAKYEAVPIEDDEGKTKFEQVIVEEEYEFQFAWDRQATFLNSQSRAIAELRSSIKQFNELADDADERKLKLEQIQLSIEKTKAEIEKIQGDNGASEDWVAALKEVAEKRKKVEADE